MANRSTWGWWYPWVLTTTGNQLLHRGYPWVLTADTQSDHPWVHLLTTNVILTADTQGVPMGPYCYRWALIHRGYPWVLTATAEQLIHRGYPWVLTADTQGIPMGPDCSGDQLIHRGYPWVHTATSEELIHRGYPWVLTATEWSADTQESTHGSLLLIHRRIPIESLLTTAEQLIHRGIPMGPYCYRWALIHRANHGSWLLIHREYPWVLTAEVISW